VLHFSEPSLDRRRALLVAGAAVALVVLYLLVGLLFGRTVARGTTVAGVDIGGLGRDEAQATLVHELADRASAPVTVTAGSDTLQIAPHEAGLALDLPATLHGLTGWTANPAALWRHLVGGNAEPLRTSVDGERLQQAVQPLAPAVATRAVEGSITLPNGRVVVVDPKPGRSLDVATTAQSVARRWPTAEPVPAALTVTQPAITAAEVARVRSEFAVPAMSAPVRVSAGGRTFEVPARALAPAITFRARGSRLEPAFDAAALVRAVRGAAEAAGVEEKPRDATVVFSGGRPTVVPGSAGRLLSARVVPSAVVPALTSPSRLAVVPVEDVQPAFTTEEATRTLPRGPISTFTTYFPDNPPRTNNITIAARTLTGTYVRPGGQFSLNGVLGQRTPEKGYKEAPVINNGRLEKDYGGGVSQVSTTTFNAAYFAGVQLDEYTPHSFYISRYPEGREATVSWPDVDQKWTNTTAGGILIRASVSGRALTVTFYGIKTWDIDSVKGPRRNVVQPKEIVDDSPGCVPQSPSAGFDVTVTRIFRKNGAQVRRQELTTHYIPEDDVTCTSPESA
jgi:vancomycin resistance protein YoaR